MINRRHFIAGATAATASYSGLRSAGAQTAVRRRVDPTNWMTWLSNNLPSFKDWPLKKIVMPGTHDSFMYKGMLPADYAKNQNLDFMGQLDNGARFFDFRIGYFYTEGLNWRSQTTQASQCFGNILSGAGWYGWGHGGPDRLVDVKVRDVLVSIRDWIGRHRSEVVILAVSGATTRLPPGGSIADLKDLFKETLGTDYIYTGGSPQNAPLSTVKGKVILLNDVGDIDGIAVQTNTVLRDTGWANVSTADDFVPKVEPKMNTFRPIGKSASDDPWMMLIQGQLTPFGTPFRNMNNSQDLARQFNPWLARRVNNEWKGRALNVVSFDYMDIGNIVQYVITANFDVPA
jgi:hypothetical protein